MVGHHGGVPGPAGQHGFHNAVAFVPGEVDVDVGRVGAAGVEEAFEIEVVLEGADVGDAQAVGHERGRPRAAAAGARAQGNDVAHDEKVGGKPLCAMRASSCSRRSTTASESSPP